MTDETSVANMSSVALQFLTVSVTAMVFGANPSQDEICNDTPAEADIFRVELINRFNDISTRTMIVRDFIVDEDDDPEKVCGEAFEFASHLRRHTHAASLRSGLPAMWQLM